MKTIRKGASGKEVRILQNLLGIDADGIFGNNTRNAVLTFQAKYALDTDGIVGAKTWAMLAKVSPTVKYGSTGQYVRAVQLLVGATEDGVFGNNTKASVAETQSDVGLTPDGVVGPKTWAYLLADTVSSGAKKPTDYKQYDSRWKNMMYSNHGDKKQTIGSSGCGPTAMANIVAAWFDPAVSPVELCACAVEQGYRTYNSGTAFDFFAAMAKRYAFAAFRMTADTDAVIAALNRGALAVACMGPGYWTKGGHYITLWKCEGGYLYANDPASSVRQRASVDIFRKQRKMYFVFER